MRGRISSERVPRHIAIIMDGNGRWAEQQGEHRVMGHANGVRSVREALLAATEIGVEYLTLYAFSTENWKRPTAEVEALMDLLVRTVIGELAELHTNGVRLNTIGDIDSLPENCRKTLQEAIEATKNNDRITITLALSYSARWEIVNMARKLATMAAQGTLDPATITDATISEHLTTVGMPDPELLIRTSGEQRVSNFLLWQIAYAELWFTPVLWPDFRKEHLFQAVLDYQNRERRFGLVSEQITPR
ncbi:MAG: isoprenyl transferase [Flavobacteriales bacterium]|nr:isoprenyl transferase [Flavobacteriales bacterium]MBK9762156.1 isoprenyl transferase [Flavobacteriales bacterium]MBP6642456.1 isoprenyl transferase [Flavobacteriales bacterium]MBP7156611.1 isoprenyl transferase [Flavobacteriales bacterium]